MWLFPNKRRKVCQPLRLSSRTPSPHWRRRKARSTSQPPCHYISVLIFAPPVSLHPHWDASLSHFPFLCFPLLSACLLRFLADGNKQGCAFVPGELKMLFFFLKVFLPPPSVRWQLNTKRLHGGNVEETWKKVYYSTANSNSDTNLVSFTIWQQYSGVQNSFDSRFL